MNQHNQRNYFLFFSVFMILIMFFDKLYRFDYESDFLIDLAKNEWQIISENPEIADKNFKFSELKPVLLKIASDKKEIIGIKTKIDVNTKYRDSYTLYLGKLELLANVFFNGSKLNVSDKIFNNIILDETPEVNRISELAFHLFQPQNNLLELYFLIDKANKRGGFVNPEPIFLMPTSEFYPLYIKRHIAGFIIAFLIIIFSIYNNILFRNIINLKVSVFFIVFCVFLSFNMLLYNPLSQILLLYSINTVLYKLSIFLLSTAIISFQFFIYYFIFPDKKYFKIISVIFASLCLLILIVSMFLTEYPPLRFLKHSFYWLGFANCILNLILVIGQVNNRVINARWLLSGLIPMAVFGFYDVFSTIYHLPVLNLVNYGLLLFVITITFSMGSNVLKIYQESEETKKNLELIVEEQTSNLKKSNEFLDKKNKVYSKYLRMAKTIQMNLLPQESNVLQKIKFKAHFLPMEALGGDFYDFYKLDENRIGFVLADVSGHGVPAALIAIMLKLTFENVIRENLNSADVLYSVNNRMNRHLVAGEYFTGIYAILDTRTNQVEYASGGHIPFILYRYETKETLLLHNTGPIMGFKDNMPFSNAYQTMYPGDRLFLFTDGVIEMSNRNEEDFGIERLRKIIEEQRNKSIDDCFHNVLNTLYTFTDISTMSDDITMLLIEIPQN